MCAILICLSYSDIPGSCVCIFSYCTHTCVVLLSHVHTRVFCMDVYLDVRTRLLLSCMSAYACAFVHTHTHTHTHTQYLYVYVMYMYMHMYIHYAYVYIYTHTHIQIYIQTIILPYWSHGTTPLPHARDPQLPKAMRAQNGTNYCVLFCFFNFFWFRILSAALCMCLHVVFVCVVFVCVCARVRVYAWVFGCALW